MTGAPTLSPEAIAELGTMPFWAKCKACGHCWVIAYLPMEATKAAKLMTGCKCPKCGDREPYIADQRSGTLMENTNG